MTFKQTFGVSNTWLIYIIAGASVVEAVIFIILHAGIIESLEWYLDEWDDDHHFWKKWPGSVLKKVEQVTYISITVQGARIIFAGILAIGRYQKQLASLVVFIFCTIIGILANLGTGIYAHQYGWTRNLAIASFVVIVLHIAYIIIAAKIYKQENGTIPGFSSAHGPAFQAPFSLPIQAPAIVINQQPIIETDPKYNSGNKHAVSQPYGHPPGHSDSLQQSYGNFSANMHPIPQQYSQSSAIMHSMPQPYVHPQENTHVAPQIYVHPQINTDAAPQTYVHPQGNVHSVQPTPPPYYVGDQASHSGPVIEEKKANVYNAF